LERTSGDKASRVNLKVVPNTKRKVVQTNVRESVEAGSHVFTDALLSYEGLSDAYTHSGGNFWSLLKRGIKGTYVCHAPLHRCRCLDEQATRCNERKDCDQGRFISTMQRVLDRRLICKKLTGKREGER
jgi:hypothetical protein